MSPYLVKFAISLLQMFREDESLLHERGVLIIRFAFSCLICDMGQFVDDIVIQAIVFVARSGRDLSSDVRVDVAGEGERRGGHGIHRRDGRNSQWHSLHRAGIVRATRAIEES